MVRKNGNNTRVFLNQGNIKGRILHRTRKNKDVIFGAQSIKKQIGLQSRRTVDFDIFTKNSKMSAKQLEKEFDKLTRGDNFYVKKGKNPGTYKIKFIGKDRIRGTEDDSTIVDYTKFPKPKPKAINIDGIRYRTLAEELKAKRKILKDPRFAFRRKKDLNDLKRILKAGKISRKGGPIKWL